MSFLNTFDSISDRVLFCQFIAIIWIYLFDWSNNSTTVFKAIKLFCNSTGFLLLIIWCFNNSVIIFFIWTCIVGFQIVVYFSSLIIDFDTLIKSRNKYRQIATAEKMEKDECKKLCDEYKKLCDEYKYEKERFEMKSQAIFTSLNSRIEKGDEQIERYKKEIEELKKSRENFPFASSDLSVF